MTDRRRLSDGVRIDDDFWNPRRETNRTETLQYQYDQLEQRGVFENFRLAAAGEREGFEGHWFADEHAYKWLEAACNALPKADDPALEHRVEGLVESIVAAQESDGYLQTYVQVREPDKRWTNLAMVTELYCGGHLIEAAIAHHRATGESTLLDVATRFADHAESALEDDAMPGHPEIELALLRLAEVTGEDRYFDLARAFVDRRGHSARFEDEFARGEEIGGHEYDEDLVEMGREFFFEDGEYDGSYAQDHAPVREQDSVEGHAVRVTYLLAAATEIAAEADDEEFFEQIETLWENMTQRRMYVTGGIGSTDGVEGFTEDYDLPNESAYAETCAAIGSIYWNQRLFEATGDATYTDLIEWTLYNAVLPGVSLSGTEFFYDNVLAADAEHSRQDWYECACCPPNLARLLASLGEYVYATDEGGLYINQYIGGTAELTIDGTEVTVSQDSNLPWDGTVALDVDAAEPTAFAIRLRMPGWADGVSIAVDGEPVDTAGVSDDAPAYVTLDRQWDDVEITVRFEMSVAVLEAHPAVEAAAGRVALTRGPLVYALEGVDHDRPLHQYAIDPTTDFEATHREGLLGGVTTLEGEATVPGMDGWDGELYRPADETAVTTAPITAVPYYAWDNRQSGEMAVWVRAGSSAGE